MADFDHERLDVYRASIEFVGAATQLVEGLPRGWASLGDQLQRASISIPLNIAEGAGELSSKEKARFYRMAARSATECAAILDVCRHLQLSEAQRVSAARDLLVRIVSMLTRLAKTHQKAGDGDGNGDGDG